MLSLELRQEIKARDKFTCKYCGCKNKILLTIDHKLPLHRGGKDNKSNLCTCCIVCNKIKGSMTPREYKKYMKSLEGLHELGKFNININNMVQHIHLYHGAGSSYRDKNV